MGKHPLISSHKKSEAHLELIDIFSHFKINGLEEKESEELLKKYEVPEKLKAPELNQILFHSMNFNAKKRDGHRVEVQERAASALAIVVSTLSLLNNETESIDPEEFKERLCDAAKLIASIIHKESEIRKAFITPGFKKIEHILREAKTDEYLYGKDLKEKVNEHQAMERMARNVKNRGPKAVGYAVQPVQKNFLGQRIPRRGIQPNLPYNMTAPGQGRPRLQLRSKTQALNPKISGSKRGQVKETK